MTLTMPAEWAPHDAVWIGFPHLAEEWAGAIDEGRHDVAAFANAVHAGGRGEEVRPAVKDERQADIAAGIVHPDVKILATQLAIGTACYRERASQYVSISEGAVP